MELALILNRLENCSTPLTSNRSLMSIFALHHLLMLHLIHQQLIQKRFVVVATTVGEANLVPAAAISIL
jgi:hypothetical protein